MKEKILNLKTRSILFASLGVLILFVSSCKTSQYETKDENQVQTSDKQQSTANNSSDKKESPQNKVKEEESEGGAKEAKEIKEEEIKEEEIKEEEIIERKEIEPKEEPFVESNLKSYKNTKFGFELGLTKNWENSKVEEINNN